MDDTSSLKDYLISFQNSWNQLYTCTLPDKNRISKELKDITDDEVINGTFLLASLEKSYKNIIDSLWIKKGDLTLTKSIHILMTLSPMETF
jgi:hypothetical protein